MLSWLINKWKEYRRRKHARFEARFNTKGATTGRIACLGTPTPIPTAVEDDDISCHAGRNPVLPFKKVQKGQHQAMRSAFIQTSPPSCIGEDLLTNPLYAHIPGNIWYNLTGPGMCDKKGHEDNGTPLSPPQHQEKPPSWHGLPLQESNQAPADSKTDTSYGGGGGDYGVPEPEAPKHCPPDAQVPEPPAPEPQCHDDSNQSCASSPDSGACATDDSGLSGSSCDVGSSNGDSGYSSCDHSSSSDYGGGGSDY